MQVHLLSFFDIRCLGFLRGFTEAPQQQRSRSMARKRVKDKAKQAALDRRLAEVRRIGLFEDQYDGVMAGLAVLVQPHGQVKLHDKAGARAAWFRQWYHRLGFTSVVVPVPSVSNKEIERRAGLPIPQKLYFRITDYRVFMRAVGQGNHWTVTDDAARAKIEWAPALEGVGEWFWADVPQDCPRLRTSRNDLMAQVTLLWLEQYVVVWHAEKAETGVMLDRNTWTWLRNVYDGSGALDASEYSGAVRVPRLAASILAHAFEYRGGRVAEVLPAVT